MPKCFYDSETIRPLLNFVRWLFLMYLCYNARKAIFLKLTSNSNTLVPRRKVICLQTTDTTLGQRPDIFLFTRPSTQIGAIYQIYPCSTAEMEHLLQFGASFNLNPGALRAPIGSLKSQLSISSD